MKHVHEKSLAAAALLLIALAFVKGPSQAETQVGCAPNLDFELRQLAGEERVTLCDAYAGKVLLVVNTASRCGFR